MEDSTTLTADTAVGSREELAELYREYHPFIRRALRRHYVTAEELEDVTHDVFVVLLRKLDEDRRPRSIKAWLYQVARRVAANHHRGTRRRARKDEVLRSQPEVNSALSGDELLAREQAKATLREFIEGLDEEACAVFVMSEVEGLRGAEIASRLGITLPMTYARIRHVRARFERRVVGRQRTWAAALGGLAKPLLAALAVALAVGKRTKIAAVVVAVLGLLWLLVGSGRGPAGDSGPPGSNGGPSGAPPTTEREIELARPVEVDDETMDGVRGGTRDRAKQSYGGVVVDPDGNPIANAVVCGDRIAVPEHMLTDPPQCTRTEADGHFSIRDVLDEAHTLSALAPGFSPGHFHGHPERSVRIVLHPGGTELSGVVLDVYGGPIADAWVAIEHLDEETLGAAVWTDDEGRFSLWAVEGRVPLAVGADGYATSFSAALAPSNELVLRLGAESIISGIVVDARGKPAPDVRVSALLLPGPERFANRGARTLTDAEGRWEIRGLQPHAYILDAAGAQSWGRAPEPIDLGVGDQHTDIEIRMIDGADIVGRIVDEATREPCPEGFVTTFDEDSSITREGKTTRDGWVVVPSLSGSARYRITVSCRGYESREFDVDVTMGQSEPYEWPLAVGRTLAVRMVDPAGAPLPDWSVRILMPEGHRLFDHQSTWRTTNADGIAEFSGLPAGTYGVRADGPGGGPLGAEEVQVEDERTDFELTARAGVAVTGQVLDGEGRPFVGALVTLQAPMPEFSEMFGPTKAQQQEIFGGGPFRATTDGRGEFRLSTVPPADYDVWIVGAASADALLVPGRADNPFLDKMDEPVQRISVAERAVHVDLRVETLRVIAGQVVDEQDDLVEGARVFVVRERNGKVKNRRGEPRLTGEDGRYSFDALLPGTYSVVAYRPGGGVVRQSGVEAGRDDVSLVFPRLGRISGQVMASSGDPIAGFRLFVQRDGDARERFIPVGSGDGSFTVSGLEAGRYAVRVKTATGRAATKVELGAGEHHTGVTLTLKPRTHVSGRLVDEHGEPRSGWRIALLPPGAQRDVENVRRHGTTHADGTFHLEDVPNEPLAVIAGPQSTPEAFAVAVELATVEVEKGIDTDVGDIVAPLPNVPGEP